MDQDLGSTPISPNKVAHGYSGDSPENFKFQGDSLQLPELEMDAVIFEAPEEYVDTYRLRLEDNGLKLVDIHIAANEKKTLP